MDAPISPTFTLSVGLRYTNDTRKLSLTLFPACGVGAEGAAGLNPASATYCGPTRQPSIATEAATGRAALEWRPAEDQLYYLQYSHGFKSGGFNPVRAVSQRGPAARPPPSPSSPTMCRRNGEAGRWPSIRLAVRSAAFWAWRSAGLVADAWGWRAAFLIAGAPGLIMAVVAALTLVEPRRALKAKMAAEAADAPAFGAALREILGSRALKFMVTGGAAKALFTYGLTAFVGSFFRNHGDQLAEIAAGFGLQTIGFVGIALGVTLGAAGIIGSYSGGYLTDRFGARDRRAYGVIPGIGRICAVPLYILALSVDDAMVALMILAPAQALSTMWPGPIYAMIQGLVGPRVRATATAVQLFMANLIGLGLGPLFLGITSDFYAKGLGMGSAEGVRYAIITFALSGIPAGLMFVFGAKTLREEMVN